MGGSELFSFLNLPECMLLFVLRGHMLESRSILALPCSAITVFFDFSRLIELKYDSHQMTPPFLFFPTNIPHFSIIVIFFYLGLSLLWCTLLLQDKVGGPDNNVRS